MNTHTGFMFEKIHLDLYLMLVSFDTYRNMMWEVVHMCGMVN